MLDQSQRYKCLNFQNILELYSNAVQQNSKNIYLAPMDKILHCSYNNEWAKCALINSLLCVKGALGKHQHKMIGTHSSRKAGRNILGFS